METNLILFFHKDYMAAADKSEMLGQNGIFPAFFYYNQQDASISYSFDFLKSFLNRQTNFIGRPDKLVAQFGDNYLSYFDIIITDILKKTPDRNAVVVFHHSFEPNAIEKILVLLQNKGINIISDTKICDIAAKKVLFSGYIPQGKKIIIYDNLSEDLAVYVCQVSENAVKIVASEVFENYGVNPYTYAVAKGIIDDISKMEKLDLQEYEYELKRHFVKVQPIVDALPSFAKPAMKIQTDLASNFDKKLYVSLTVDEIKNLAAIYSKNLTAFFNDFVLNKNNIKLLDIEKVVFLSDSMKCTEITNEFGQFGNIELIFFSSVKDIIGAAFTDLTPHDDEATMFMVDDTVETDNFVKVDNVNILQLQSGTKIKLENFDPRPGKGESLQIFVKNTLGQLEVVDSTRSLKKGDIAIPLTTTWQTGMQILLEIIRNGQKIGKFQTRPVVNIYTT